MKEKKGSGFGRFLIALILAIVVFIALLIIQSNVMNKTKTVPVLVAKGAVEAKTDITKDNYKNYFEVVDRVESQLPEGSVQEKDVKNIDGVTISDNLVKGEILNSGDYVKTEDFISYLGDGKVKVGFALGDLQNLICGTLRRGDVVDITAIYYEDNDKMSNPKATTLSNVVIEKAYDSSGAEIKDDTTAATMFSFILTPEQNEALNSMLVKNANVTRISKKTDITYGITDITADVKTEEISNTQVDELMDTKNEK